MNDLFETPLLNQPLQAPPMNAPKMETDVDRVNKMNEMPADIKEWAESFEISDEMSNLVAGRQLVLIKQLQKQIEEYHKKEIKQAYDHHKALKARMDGSLEKPKAAEKMLKEKLAEFGGEVQAKGVSVKKVIKAEIVDLDSIPEDFLEVKPNLKAIEAVLKAGGTIPGVKPIESKSIAVRA
jgi:hypothetical protein